MPKRESETVINLPIKATKVGLNIIHDQAFVTSTAFANAESSSVYLIRYGGHWYIRVVVETIIRNRPRTDRVDITVPRAIAEQFATAKSEDAIKDLARLALTNPFNLVFGIHESHCGFGKVLWCYDHLVIVGHWDDSMRPTSTLTVELDLTTGSYQQPQYIPSPVPLRTTLDAHGLVVRDKDNTPASERMLKYTNADHHVLHGAVAYMTMCPSCWKRFTTNVEFDQELWDLSTRNMRDKRKDTWVSDVK